MTKAKMPKDSVFPVVGLLIETGESLSNAVDCSGGVLFKIWMPPEWTDAQLTFQTSIDGTTFHDVFDQDGHEVTFTVSLGTVVLVDFPFPLGWLKVRSGTRELPVVQTERREFALVLDKRG